MSTIIDNAASSAALPPPVPLPGDVDDALRNAYRIAKSPVTLRPVIDQTILNAARENARAAQPFYKKIPWYTQFSMAGAVFGSLFLSAIVIYKTVVFKHDKGVENLVTADAKVQKEEARQKAPMVVSILAENLSAEGSRAILLTPVTAPTSTASIGLGGSAAKANQVNTAASAASTNGLPGSTSGTVSSAEVAQVQQPMIVAEAAKPRAGTNADTDSTSRARDKAVLAEAAAPASPANASAPAFAAAPAAAAPRAAATAGSAPVAARAAPPVLASAPAAPQAAITTENPQAWQTRIEALLRAGKKPQAQVEIAALLKRYPNTILSDEIKRLLAQ